MKKVIQKIRKKLAIRDQKAQILPIAMVVGTVMLIFALAMVKMLSTTIKMNVKVNKGTSATLGADSVVDKAIYTLAQGDNWGGGVTMAFTPIPGYRGDKVYTDVPNSQYIVQINPGNLFTSPGDQARPLNLTSASGDKANERTITVDFYGMPTGFPTPSVQPTPWVLSGGQIPAGFANHRTLRAVVRRAAVSAAMVTGGILASQGFINVYWGDVYSFKSNAATNATVIDLGSTQPLGPGYPSFHTASGCIASAGSCAGCWGAGSGTGAFFCRTTDTGAANCKMFAKDPAMPNKPVIKVAALKQASTDIYSPAGSGISSGESGYFYFQDPISTPGPGPNSVTVTGCVGCAAPNEADHQYTTNASGSPRLLTTADQLTKVRDRMAQNLGAQGYGVTTGSWVGADDLIFFLDTTDGLPLAANYSNRVTSDGTADSVRFWNFGFRGTFCVQGHWGCDDPMGSQPSPILMSPPAAAAGLWCPSAFTGNPAFVGFLYVGGNIADSNGAPNIYGSMYVEGDILGGATFTIYYRDDFKYNLLRSGAISTSRWQEVKTFPTPMP